MDLAHFSEERFRQIEKDYVSFLRDLGLAARAILPLSASTGENVTTRSRGAMPWFDGTTLLGALDELDVANSAADQPLRFPIQDVYRIENRRIFAGRIESGTLRLGDQLVFSPHYKTARVATIERWPAAPAEFASAGESIGITLSDHIFIERGPHSFPPNRPAGSVESPALEGFLDRPGATRGRRRVSAQTGHAGRRVPGPWQSRM